jgi:hypothetical protein
MSLLKTFDEFCASITPEQTKAWEDQQARGERDFGPISERLDALNEAIWNEGWCPSHDLKYELKHLNNVITAYHVGKYPKETRQTLDDAEAEIATWRTLSEAARDEIIAADERAEAEMAERRKARQAASARKAAIYEAARRTGMPLSPAMEDALAYAC